MSFKTDMIERILKSQKGQEMIKMISPHYGEAYTFLWLMQVIGMALDETQDWSDKIATEVTPLTVTWSINFWELEYGITPEPWWSLEQRRQNLMSVMHYFRPMPPKRLDEIVQNVSGLKIEIIENTGKNTFDVAVREIPADFERISSQIERYKPAHLIYKMYVAAQIFPKNLTVFTGLVIGERKKYYVEVM